MKKILVGFLLALAACSTNEPLPPVVAHPVLPPKIALDVQTISLADRSGIQSANSPYNGNHFTPTINEAIRQWAGDRLQAAGQTGQAIVLIKESSLTAQPIAVKSGMDGWFTRQQSVKYVARAEMSIEANGREGFATSDATATRTVTLPENPTPMEKQEAYYSLLNGLMKDLGQNMESSIQAHMASFVITAPVLGNMTVPVNPQATTSSIPAAPMMDAPVAPMQGSGVVPLSGQ